MSLAIRLRHSVILLVGTSPNLARVHMESAAVSGLAARSAVGLDLGPGSLRPRIPLKSVVVEFGDRSLLSFVEAIEAVEAAAVIPEVLQFGRIARRQAEYEKGPGGRFHGHPLDEDLLAALLKYSAEDTDPPLYREMNKRCFDPDRRMVKHFAGYMWLLVNAMHPLEPYPNRTVFRGVRLDISVDYPEGRRFTWQSFISTTNKIKVLENEMFCGKS